jgi:hypothetical protein
VALIESATHHAVRNLAKAKASLTMARTAANAIYCPPLLQANIDCNAGCLHAEEKDFKTAFSYFYEALENYDSINHARGMDCLKYMLLCKIMLNNPDEVTSIINGKPGMRHQGEALEAMRAVGTAHQQRSLHDFEAALSKHGAHLRADPIISTQLTSLYDMLLQENICRIIEPYSRVETAHIASLMNLPLRQIEEKLSQMILDKKFKVRAATARAATLQPRMPLRRCVLCVRVSRPLLLIVSRVPSSRSRRFPANGVMNASSRVVSWSAGHLGRGRGLPHRVRGRWRRLDVSGRAGDADQHGPRGRCPLRQGEQDRRAARAREEGGGQGQEGQGQEGRGEGE